MPADCGKNLRTIQTALLQKIHPVLKEPEDFYRISKKYDAIYKGVINFTHYAGQGLRNLDNNDLVIHSSNLEDHHIFPKDYLKSSFVVEDSTIDKQILVDCVLNRTLIAKLTNIKVSNKAPSKYLSEIANINSSLASSLSSHIIPDGLLTGSFDIRYQEFLERRGAMILSQLNSKIIDERNYLIKVLQP
jgi:hypothetical protein